MISHPNYVTSEFDVSITSGRVRSFRLEQLKIQPIISIRPPLARVTFVEIKRTYMALRLNEDIPIGIHSLTIEADGYLTLDTTIQIKSEQTRYVYGLEKKRLLATAIPDYGSLSISILPRVENIKIDGLEYGGSIYSFGKFPARVHTLEVTSAKYLSLDTTFTVQKDIDNEVDIVLKRRSLVEKFFKDINPMVSFDGPMQSAYGALSVTSRPKSATLLI